MKSEKIRLYTIEFILIIFFLLTIIFNNIITRQVMAIVLLVFMVISVLLIKTDKKSFTNNRQVIILLGGIGIIYVALIYLLGILTGFYSASVKLSFWSVLNYIIPYIVIIISSEIIRKTILLKESKYSKIIILIAMVMLDVILNTNIYSLNTMNDYLTLIGFIIFSSIANNLLFNYIIIRYRNYKAIIIYRLITTLYVYIFPIIPNIYIFLESIIKMVVPYIIYNILESLYAKNQYVISIRQKKKEKIITILFFVFIAIIVMLVSCKFKFGLLVIGSGSMTGTINKGDVVFVEKYNKKDEINTGDIIVFANDNKKIVHRIIEQKIMGEETRYYTKGDANQQEDDGYRKREDIIGHIKCKIPYVGYFTLWLNNLIGGNK